MFIQTPYSAIQPAIMHLLNLKHLNFATDAVRPVCSLKIMLALTRLPELSGSCRSGVVVGQEEE